MFVSISWHWWHLLFLYNCADLVWSFCFVGSSSFHRLIANFLSVWSFCEVLSFPIGEGCRCLKVFFQSIAVIVFLSSQYLDLFKRCHCASLLALIIVWQN